MENLYFNVILIHQFQSLSVNIINEIRSAVPNSPLHAQQPINHILEDIFTLC